MKENPMGYRLTLGITGEREIITQDIFSTIDVAKEAVYSVVEDLSSRYKDVKNNGLIITDIPRFREDGKERYIGRVNGYFDGGKFCIDIILNTVENEDLEIEEINDKDVTINDGVFRVVTIKGLGEFKLMFSDKGISEEPQGKYYMEVLWNPEEYDLTDLIFSQYVDDIDKEMESIADDMDFYISQAKEACMYHIEFKRDDIDGIYGNILNSFFNEESEQDDVTNIRGLDEKIEAMLPEIITQYQEQYHVDDMDVNDLSQVVAKKLSGEDIKSMIKIIHKTIDAMAIVVKVTYDPQKQSFELDFRIDNIDDQIYGKVVPIKLQDILAHKFIYRQNINAAVIATLLYSLVQKEVA